MTLVLLASGLLAGLAVAQAAAPATAGSRRRTAARRARYVAAHPTSANPTDIVAALCRAGVGSQRARRITDRALDHGIRAFTMWLWLEQFGAESFQVVVAADATHLELLTHICRGELPDMDVLALFASVNGLDPVA